MGQLDTEWQAAAVSRPLREVSESCGPKCEPSMGKLDARWKHGYIFGRSKSSNGYYIFGEAGKKMKMARGAQRVPLD